MVTDLGLFGELHHFDLQDKGMGGIARVVKETAWTNKQEIDEKSNRQISP